jgi:hypothetical protein
MENAMSDVIDLAAERNRREGPDPEHIRPDGEGGILYAFCFSYRMNGSQYTFNLFAYDFEDAERRAKAMRNSVQVDGQLISVVPV